MDFAHQDFRASLFASVPRRSILVLVMSLNAAIGKAVNTAEMKEPFTRQGFEPKASTPEQLAAFLETEMAQNAKLVKLTGLKAD